MSLITRAFAQTTNIRINLPSYLLSGDTGFNTIWQAVYEFVFAILVLMALMGIIYSGVMMITSGGDAAKFAAGRKNLIWAIVGVVVLLMAYFIVNFVNKFVGDAVNFRN